MKKIDEVIQGLAIVAIVLFVSAFACWLGVSAYDDLVKNDVITLPAKTVCSKCHGPLTQGPAVATSRALFPNPPGRKLRGTLLDGKKIEDQVARGK